MTLTFDKNAIIKEKTQTRLIDIMNCEKDTNINDMTVKKVNPSYARQFIASYHYSHILPDSVQECYAGFYGNKLAGVICYGRGANNNTFSALIPDMELKNCRELVRLWSPDGMPKNTESKLISQSIKMLPKEIYMVVSFADPSHNHRGTIYQATNFYYCGKSNPSKMLQDKEDNIFHIRTIGSYKRRHPEIRKLSNKDIMKKYNWKYIESSGKHRYVYLRGEKWIKNMMFKEIQNKIIDYPSEISLSGKIFGFQPEVSGSNPESRTIILEQTKLKEADKK